MKILILSHFVPYPPHGGAIQRNYNLFRAAAAAHEVHLLTFTQRKRLPTKAKLDECVAACRKIFKNVTVLELPTEYSSLRWYSLLLFNLFSLTPYSIWKFHTRQMVTKLRNLIDSGGFDLVHVDTIALAEYINYLGATPAVLNHHNIESSLMLRRGHNENNPIVKLYILMQGWKLRRYEKKMASRFSMNIMVSELDKAELISFCPTAKADVVPNGTDIDYYLPLDHPQTNTLIFTGSMTWYPNRDAMIFFCREVFPIIKQQIPDVQMLVIGSMPPKEVTDAAAKEPAIKVLGWVDDIRELVATSAVYVVPIRVGGGTRLKILDAMAQGKAIVSTTVGCEGIEVTPDVNILVGDSPAEFAAKVVTLLHDQPLRQRLQNNARKFVEDYYAWAGIARRLDQIYQNLGR
jgi:glycosyltransferase involved in cell wall biosynthesis